MSSVPATDVLTSVVQVSVGGGHVCAIAGSTRKLYCWGRAEEGQLGVSGSALCDPGNGDGHLACSKAPVDVSLEGVQLVSAGYLHTCVTMVSGGAVRCWGRNEDGQLGTGNKVDELSIPTSPVLSGATIVTCGNRHTCAMTNIGTVSCWGSNGLGQLGLGAQAESLTPATAIYGAMSVATGPDFTCVVQRFNGGVRCWGLNLDGQLGIGSKGAGINTPPPYDILIDARSITVGWNFVCAITGSAFELRCWGSDRSGALGDGAGESAVTAPPTTPVATGINHVSARLGNHACAVTNDNFVKCWGENYGGQLGNGGTSPVFAVHVPATGITIPGYP